MHAIEINSQRVLVLDIFETPVTVTPQQEISKTLNSAQISLKMLSVYFWGTSVYFGERAFTFGERAFILLGIIGVFGIFGISFFVAGGFSDSVGRGAP